MRKLTDEQLKEALEKHRKWLWGESGGERADFAGVNFYLANLGGANLRSANLGGADLGGANLRSANLGGANLGGANLRSADLRSANLGGADLGGANLRSADLGGANLRSANLGGADLGGKTFLGRILRIIGACTPAVDWVDSLKDHSDWSALFADAQGDWKSWLTDTLGGDPTRERLMCVVEYITPSEVLAEIKATAEAR